MSRPMPPVFDKVSQDDWQALSMARFVPERLSIALASNPEPLVRYGAILYQRLSDDALRAFAEDDNQLNLRWLIANHALPVDLLRSFATDPSRMHRLLLLGQPRMTFDVLEILMRDPDEVVSALACDTAEHAFPDDYERWAQARPRDGR